MKMPAHSFLGVRIKLQQLSKYSLQGIFVDTEKDITHFKFQK